MEGLKEFIDNWGYVAVFLGALVEGESVILTASVLAYQGYLSIIKVMLTAFAGTMFADQTLFYVGRYYGKSLIKRFPSLQKPADRAFTLLHKWDTAFILSFRFVYGIRTVSPIVIGASGLSPRRYTPLNFIAAVIWTVISCMGGYLLGSSIERLLDGFHTVQKYIFIGLFLLVGGICLRFYMQWRRRRAATHVEEHHWEELPEAEEILKEDDINNHHRQ